MVDNEKIEVHSDEGSFADEYWNEPEQNEAPESRHKRTSMRYNRYSDDFLIDKIKLDEIGADLVSVVDLVPNKEWQIIDDDESFWQEDYSIPEREMDQEQSETENRAHTNLRIREWIYDLPSDEIEGQLKKQVDISAAKEMKERNPSFG